jgi:hypothetical protein
MIPNEHIDYFGTSSQAQTNCFVPSLLMADIYSIPFFDCCSRIEANNVDALAQALKRHEPQC